jgi:AcrR family transcriptional regulator
MKRQRISREQSREQTRERLLEASHAVFNQKGFALASVEDITAAAGYSRGAFYSNFDDKTELFFELLRREGVEIDSEIQRLLELPIADPVQIKQQIAAYYSQLYRDESCSLLWMEARIVALRDEKFRSQFNTFLDGRHRQIATFVETFSRISGEPPAAPPQQIAIGLMALCEGVSFAHRCDPQRINESTAEAVLSLFLSSVMAMPPASAASSTLIPPTEKTLR